MGLSSPKSCSHGFSILNLLVMSSLHLWPPLPSIRRICTQSLAKLCLSRRMHPIMLFMWLQVNLSLGILTLFTIITWLPLLTIQLHTLPPVYLLSIYSIVLPCQSVMWGPSSHLIYLSYMFGLYLVFQYTKYDTNKTRAKILPCVTLVFYPMLHKTRWKLCFFLFFQVNFRLLFDCILYSCG